MHLENPNLYKKQNTEDFFGKWEAPDFTIDLLTWVLTQPADTLEKTLIKAFTKIRTFFDVYSCGFLEIAKDSNEINLLLNSCGNPQIEAVTRNINIASLYPSLYQSLCDNGTHESRHTVISLPVKTAPADPVINTLWHAWKDFILYVFPLCPMKTRGKCIGLWANAEAWHWIPENARYMCVLGDIFEKCVVLTDKENQLFADELQVPKTSRAAAFSVRTPDPGDIVDNTVVCSPSMRHVVRKMQQVAKMDTTVLITGETGTGKGVLARMLHRASRRSDRPFVEVNCGGFPAGLIESELFGREKGAFTGATEKQIGRFELAHGGTLFLDEIGELPLELQPKLLRAIECGEFERLGNPRAITVDTRIIASTNRNLKDLIRKGNFRSDLFYRINVFPIRIPPLRERKDDVPCLVEFYLNKFNKQCNKKITHIPDDTMHFFRTHDWPGNVRELVNVIERSVIVSDSSSLQLAEHTDGHDSFAAHIPVPIDHDVSMAGRSLANVEREHILAILQSTGWLIEGRNGAASMLRMKPSTLRARMKKLKIKRP